MSMAREVEEWRVEGIIKRTNGDISFAYTWSNLNGASGDPKHDALSYVSMHQWVREPRITWRRIIVQTWKEYDGTDTASV